MAIRIFGLRGMTNYPNDELGFWVDDLGGCHSF